MNQFCYIKHHLDVRTQLIFVCDRTCVRGNLFSCFSSLTTWLTFSRHFWPSTRSRLETLSCALTLGPHVPLWSSSPSKPVIITVPFPCRICECLVEYFDSSSPDSRNVFLVVDCAFYSLLYNPAGFFRQTCSCWMIQDGWLLINFASFPKHFCSVRQVLGYSF